MRPIPCNLINRVSRGLIYDVILKTLDPKKNYNFIYIYINRKCVVDVKLSLHREQVYSHRR